jgi:penicillin-binding protein 2
VALGAVLIGRMGWLSVAQNEKYQLLSESNRVQLSPVSPRRGWIIDRFGKPIAINRSSFRIDIIPQQLEDPEKTLKTVVELLQLTTDDVERILTELKQGHGFQPVQVAENVSYDQYAAVTVRLPDLPGIQAPGVFPAITRTDPPLLTSGLRRHCECPEYEAEDKKPAPAHPRIQNQKAGRRTDTRAVSSRNPRRPARRGYCAGKLVKGLTQPVDRSGRTVQLTIDQGLQQYAARRMGDQSGALVAMDVATGDMLAFVSMPAFDPNSFSDGIGRTEWKMLSDNDHIPLLNKVAQGLYPSGSTIKPAMALAFLKQGVDPKRRVVCNGGYQIGNRYFRCDAVHGSMDMRAAVERSCNTYFWATGPLRIPSRRRRWYNIWDTVESTCPFRVAFGTMPNPKWLQKKYNRKWQDMIPPIRRLARAMCWSTRCNWR